jgi:hypothetical protein
MKLLLERGLRETDPMWEAVETAFGWVHQAARILKNDAEIPGTAVRRRMGA